MNPFKAFFLQKQDKKVALQQVIQFSKEAKEFADKHPNTLLVMGDINTDVLFATYKGVVTTARILNQDGYGNKIVANAMKHTRGDADIDRFLLAVDGLVFNLAKALYDKRRSSLVGKVVDFVKGPQPAPTASAVNLTDGSKLSPVQVIE